MINATVADIAAAIHQFKAANTAAATRQVNVAFFIFIGYTKGKSWGLSPPVSYRFRLGFTFRCSLRGGFSFRMFSISAIVATIAVHALKKISM